MSLPVAGSCCVGSGNDASTGLGWMGSLQAYALRTLLNMSVTMQNVVLKCELRESVATLMLGSINVKTASDDWRSKLQVCACLNCLSSGLSQPVITC